jgi:hypothetical protein
LTQLLVCKYHQQAMNSRPKKMCALMARRYSLLIWAVKNIIYNCQHCQERTSIPVKYPPAALHKNTLQAWTHAFHNTGIYHFGLFEARQAKKAWALLLICLRMGAVHCEPVDTLSVDSHLNLLDWFVT